MNEPERSELDELELLHKSAGRVSIKRAAAVTAGLSVFGAGAGALFGGLGACVLEAIAEHSPAPFLDGVLFSTGAIVGGAFGAILMPVAGLALMRRVPLGRAFVGTLVGTFFGGIIGSFFPKSAEAGWFPNAFVGGLIGFLFAVLALRTFANRTTKRKV